MFRGNARLKSGTRAPLFCNPSASRSVNIVSRPSTASEPNDETNRRVRPDRITRMVRRAGGRALIGLVGVQSNQFPRAVDLARPFVRAGLPDNFARNPHWEPLFDRMIQLRVGEGLKIGFTIQVDTLCHRIPNFIEKAAQAGVRRVFIGLENINPDNLLAAKKRQNKITEYRAMLQKWGEHGAITCAGYISGFPGDTKASILRDIEIIKREFATGRARALHADAAPGLRGPQGPISSPDPRLHRLRAPGRTNNGLQRTDLCTPKTRPPSVS